MEIVVNEKEYSKILSLYKISKSRWMEKIIVNLHLYFLCLELCGAQYWYQLIKIFCISFEVGTYHSVCIAWSI